MNWAATTRRHVLASAAALLASTAAGCSAMDVSDSDPRSTATATTTNAEFTTDTTPTTTTPTLNRTRYPAVQQQSRTDESVLPAKTAILADENWREHVSESALDAATVEFVEATDLRTHYPVAFEVEVTEWATTSGSTRSSGRPTASASSTPTCCRSERRDGARCSCDSPSATACRSA